jgi:hypothetical protein
LTKKKNAKRKRVKTNYNKKGRKQVNNKLKKEKRKN